MNARPAPYDLFQWLPDEVRDAFTRAARIKHYPAGAVLYFAGDSGSHMYRLVTGSVRLSLAGSDGQEIIYGLYGPGDCFGQSSLIDGKPRSQSAHAGGKTEVQVLDEQAFGRLRLEYQEFDRALLKLFTFEGRQLSNFFAESHLFDLTCRVASRIVTAINSFGIAGNNATRLSVTFPQSELALMVGASRQAVNRVLRNFEEEGLIVIEYGNLSILELDQLKLRALPKEF